MDLIAGESDAMQWLLDEDVLMARLDIGSGPRCAWRITASGVAETHFELFWNGQQVYAGDERGSGAVTVNGTPLSGWEPLEDGSLIEFGDARIVVRANGRTVKAEHSSVRPAPVRFLGGEEMVGLPTREHRPGDLEPTNVGPDTNADVPLVEAENTQVTAAPAGFAATDGE
jgi:pSer/pThr/pTyr-binding forkhead associated (FHA) protein